VKFVIAEDGCYYNHDKIVSLSRDKFEHGKECHEVLYAIFVGVSKGPVRLFTSTDVPHGVDTYLREHDLEVVKW
jgi:hypothetical protein